MAEKPMRRLASCDAETGGLCHHAEQASEDAADSAVKKVFAILGVYPRRQRFKRFLCPCRFRARWRFLIALRLPLIRSLSAQESGSR